LRQIRGVAFFGTPHKGSDIATWADIFANILRAASLGTSTNRRLTKDLKGNAEVLADISKSFVDRSKALKIVSFYESDMMDFMNCKVSPYMSSFYVVVNINSSYEGGH
jgi:LDH2 family malate/lactate/ureidoglycolate dehydrogenase